MIQSGTKVRVRHGSEGPAWDPYSFEEVTIWRHGKEYTIRLGLGVWIQRGATRKGRASYESWSEEEMIALFTEWTGASPWQWLAWHERASHPRRCRRCGRPNEWLGDGYVGEGVYGCTKCDVIAYCGEVTEAMIE